MQTREIKARDKLIVLSEVALWVLTETLALIGGPVHEDFGGNDVAKGQKHLHELRVAELLRQVVNK